MSTVYRLTLLFCFALVLNADDDSGIKFKGTIQALPASAGFVGNWTVAGRTIIVTNSTKLESNDAPFGIGTCVEVKGQQTGSAVQATKIETKDREDCTQATSDFTFFGNLERLPMNGMMGDWLVSGRMVQVNSATVIDQHRGPATLGSCLEITGAPGFTNAILATRIEVTSGNGGCRSGSETMDVDFRGVVQSMNTNTWTVSGRNLLITSATQILPNGRRTEIGDCVNVSGFLRSDGMVTASRVQRLGGGACREFSGPPVEPAYVGLVQQLPATGLIGDWRVGTQTVRVSNQTAIDTDRGPVGVGTCVEARGQFSGAVLLANRIETQDPARCARDSGRFELTGIIETVPSGGRSGNWTISGRIVTANDSTVFDTSRGALIVGACVEAEGLLGQGNALLATRIQVASASGVCLAPGGIVNAGSLSSLGVSPGLIISLFGFNIGPATQLPFQVTGGMVPSQLGRTRVLFDGVPATMLFVSQSQVNAIVPCSVAGRTQTVVQIESNGAWSNPITIPVSLATPSLFTISGAGTGPGAILNQNYQLNQPSTPAARNSVVILYGTGFGQTNPSCTDGTVTPVLGPLPRPVQQVTLTIGGRPATVQYVGAAPGLVTGVIQLNAVVPGDVTPGPNVPVVVTVGGRNSQSGVTMAVQ